MTNNGPGDHGPEDAVEVVDACMTGAFELGATRPASTSVTGH